MRIEVHAEPNDEGIPIEFANALIKKALKDVTDYEIAELRKKELAEIAEHIQIYLKYNKEWYL